MFLVTNWPGSMPEVVLKALGFTPVCNVVVGLRTKMNFKIKIKTGSLTYCNNRRRQVLLWVKLLPNILQVGLSWLGNNSDLQVFSLRVFFLGGGEVNIF